jgi:hypothetical protein
MRSTHFSSRAGPRITPVLPGFLIVLSIPVVVAPVLEHEVKVLAYQAIND